MQEFGWERGQGGCHGFRLQQKQHLTRVEKMHRQHRQMTRLFPRRSTSFLGRSSSPPPPDPPPSSPAPQAPPLQTHGSSVEAPAENGCKQNTRQMFFCRNSSGYVGNAGGRCQKSRLQSVYLIFFFRDLFLILLPFQLPRDQVVLMLELGPVNKKGFLRCICKY